MSKRVEAKIKLKHTSCHIYTNKLKFDELLCNTIASSSYDTDSKTINFIAYIESTNNFILYALKREKHHTTCSTIFKLKPSTLKKYYKDDKFRLLKNNYEIVIEKYIN